MKPPRAAWRWIGAAGRCLVICLLPALPTGGQVPQPVLPHAGLPGLKTITQDEYHQHLLALQALVSACMQQGDRCDAGPVGELDDSVHPAAGSNYIERYGWLRDLLADRDDPGHKRRTDLLPRAAERLRAQLQELDSPQIAPLPLSGTARGARTAVLAGREFQATQDYSLMERISSWVSGLLNRLFGGFSTLGRAAPWLGTALQWGALTLAAALLLLWIYRAVDRQRVLLGRLHGDAAQQAAQAESRAWAAQAQAHADRGEWRDAVHALYWASIVLLEDRRTLRRSGTRTPREALRLVDPASFLLEPLRAQTGDFERIWYGMQPAGAEEYRSANGYFQQLQAGSPRGLGA